eukprot:CAMPEP_0115431996 /NCGR_PEP_ID=MMETSP0271-20121206/31863_1 /TAXON_ID=71861 /ORGANISM="Scrippsiella trochoidea, Strain CCMP3099" /LENGTH=157 /DNA_ID=CAMNT_0002857303 /DNA_START=61 /DNA_END=532 /DNA_ORIENTATION=+
MPAVQVLTSVHNYVRFLAEIGRSAPEPGTGSIGPSLDAAPQQGARSATTRPRDQACQGQKNAKNHSMLTAFNREVNTRGRPRQQRAMRRMLRRPAHNLPEDLVARQLLDVCDVIPRVAVERLLQPQLVKVVADETDGAAQHEQPIEATKRHQVITLL